MPEGVFFDLDGTLLDTLPDIRACLNASLEEYGCDPLTERQVRAFVGDGARRLVLRALPGKQALAEAVYRSFLTRYNASENPHTRIFDGMENVVRGLKARGVKLAVVTNKPQEAARRAVEQFFPGIFDCILGDSGMFPCKPDPTSVRYAALGMHTAIGRCVFVGDGEADVLTASNAGMAGVFVLWGYRTREQLEQAGARNFAETPAELENFFAKFI